MSTDESRDWSALPQAAMDGIVNGVIKHGRWRREGPTLRTLDKRWCDAVNRHVVRVRPQPTTLLFSGDAKALSKFPNLATVDVTQFVVPSILFVPDAEGLILDLAAKPSLTRLEATLELCTEFLENSDLSQLSSLRDLHLKHRDDWGSEDDDDDDDEVSEELIENICQIPLLERLFCEAGFSDLSYLLSSAPALKHLSVGDFKEETIPEDITALNSLESFSILGGHQQSLDELLALRTLVHLGIAVPSSEVHKLASLTSLKSLDLCLEVNEDGEDVNLTPLSALSKLASLSLDTEPEELDMHLILDAPLMELACLDLESCALHGAQLRDYLPNLKSLLLDCCTIHETEALMAVLKNLEALMIGEVLDENDEHIEILWRQEDVPNLRTLWMTFDRFNHGSLSSVFSLVQLEKLALTIDPSVHDVSVDGVLSTWVEELVQLKNLKELGLFGFDVDGLDELSPEFLDNLEVLYLNDILGTMLDEGVEDEIDSLDWFYNEAPHLSEGDFEIDVEAWFGPFRRE